MLRAKCPQCGFDLDEMRMARWRAYDRMVWCLGVSAMGFVAFILVVLAATVLFPQSLCDKRSGGMGKAKADLVALDSALEEYSLANGGRYPDTLRVLVTPDRNGYTYIQGTRIPFDPWGNEYLYDPPRPDQRLPRIYTLGGDGSPGGEGDKADLDNLSLREDR